MTYVDTGQTTPGRETTVTFDIDGDTIVVADHVGGIRYASQICAPARTNRGADSQYVQGLRYWPGPRCWTLRPVQESNPRFHENLPVGLLENDFIFADRELQAIKSANSGGLAPIKTLQFVTSYFEFANRQYAKMKGLPGSFVIVSDVNPSVQPVGDYFIWYRLPASGPNAIDYTDKSFQHPPQNIEAASGLLSLPAPTTRLFPIAFTSTSMRADQGFFLRWCVPGTPNQYPDYILNWWFGQYCLVIGGDGMAKLLEYCRPAGSNVYRWTFRTSWRYCEPHQVLNRTHTLLVYPVTGSRGEKYIVFSNSQVDSAGVYGPSADNAEYTWLADPVTRGGDKDEAPGHITKTGPFRIDHRRDVQVAWHASLLIFNAQGTLIDQPWTTRVSSHIVTGVPTPVELNYSVIATLPDGGGYSTAIQISDALTGAVYTPGNSTTWAAVKTPTAVITLSAPAIGSGTVPPGTHLSAQAASDTPILYGYQLFQDALTTTLSPGQFIAHPRNVSVEQSDISPDNERATIDLFDPTAALERLAVRGELAAKIDTTFLPPAGGGPTTVTLFRGYAESPHKTRTGMMDGIEFEATGTVQGLPQGGFSGGAPTVFPDPLAGHYAVTLTGMCRRLLPDRRNLQQLGLWRKYAYDPKAGGTTLPDGTKVAQQPWKVTDAMKDMLTQAGYGSMVQGIPDLPMRLWPGVGTQTDDFQVDIYTDFLSTAVRWARAYLGAVFVFDANWAPRGSWTLILNAGTPGQTPIFHFLTYCPAENIPPTFAGAYPANTGFVSGPLKSYVVAPQWNSVVVATKPEELIPGYDGPTYAIQMSNPQSYAVPGSDIVPDPNSPHYVPDGQRALLIVDPTLVFTGSNGDAMTQLAVNFTCRRYFDFLCVPRLIRPMECPLYFIEDPTHGAWRPLRYGDPVTFDGDDDWFVRNANGNYSLDTHQVSYTEIDKTIAIEPVTHTFTAGEIS